MISRVGALAGHVDLQLASRLFARQVLSFCRGRAGSSQSQGAPLTCHQFMLVARITPWLKAVQRKGFVYTQSLGGFAWTAPPHALHFVAAAELSSHTR